MTKDDSCTTRVDGPEVLQARAECGKHITFEEDFSGVPGVEPMEEERL